MTSVLFAQLPPPRLSFHDPCVNIPLAAGFLDSVIRAFKNQSFEVEILGSETLDVFADSGLAERIARIKPDILGLTLYVWNVQRSLFLASNLKKKLPEMKVVVGGPEVTPDNRWVLGHPSLDAGVFGEGESRIIQCLCALTRGTDLSQIPGIFFNDGHNRIINGPSSTSWDLSRVPYPYLDGRLKPSKDGTIFLETVRGCPYRCRYCYYHKSFSGVRQHPEKSVSRILDYAYSPDNGVDEIYLMDPTFNVGIRHKKLLTQMSSRRKVSDVRLHAELRADFLNRDDVSLMRDAGLVSAEVGLQTTNTAALKRAGRSQDLDAVARGVGWLKEAGIHVTTGIIVGMPGDSPDGVSATLGWLKETGAYSVVHPFVLSVLPGTYFRENADSMGLAFDSRPPYYVKSVPGFSSKGLRDSLLECELVLDIEMDSISTPSLVDRGEAAISSVDQSEYISKWILDPNNPIPDDLELTYIFKHATDPFTFWFKSKRDVGSGTEQGVSRILEKFVFLNPHCSLQVIIEFPGYVSTNFLLRLIQSCSNLNIYINRIYQPLYADDEIVSPNFVLIFPDPGSATARRSINNIYENLAQIIWEFSPEHNLEISSDMTPLLISQSFDEIESSQSWVWESLLVFQEVNPDQLFFRDPIVRRTFLSRTPNSHLHNERQEKILVHA
jgi:hypothetical protein